MSEPLHEQIVRYYTFDQAIKQLDEQKKPLNSSIKSEMKDMGIKSLDCDGIVATYSVQERTSLNQEMLLSILKTRGLSDAIETKEHPKPEVVERLIYEGVLSPADLAKCNQISYVEVLKVSKKRGKKNG